MKDKLKGINKMLEKELTQYAQEMESGKQMTDKDPERLSSLMSALAYGKLLCMLEDIKEKGLTGVLEGGKGKSKEGGEESKDPMEMLKKMFGGGQSGFGMNNTGGWSPLQMQNHIPGMSPMNNYNNYSPENRRGVSGTRSSYDSYDTYSHYEDDDNDDMEMRHRGKNGRWVKNSYDDGADSRYMPQNNRNTSPQNSTVITDKQGVPGTGAGTQGR